MKRKGKVSELNREELINLCRYYKGEEENPYERKDNNKAMLWFYEQGWVIDTLRHGEEGGSCLEEYATDYISAGMVEFRRDDMIPMSLKALLFNRYMRGSMDGNTEPFKKFFNKYY